MSKKVVKKLDPEARAAWVAMVARDIAHMTPADREAADNDAWHEETTDACFRIADACGVSYSDALYDGEIFSHAVEMVGDARGAAERLAQWPS